MADNANNTKNKVKNRITVKQPSARNSESNNLLLVLNRIANALEERNLYEQRLFKLEEKIKKFELKEHVETYKKITEGKENNKE